MNDLILSFMQDVYDAEKRGIRGLAKLAKSVQNEEVKEAVLQHREQSQQQVSRLERVFEMIGKRPRGKTCRAMEGLTDEVDEAIEDGEKGPVLDAALIAGAQAIEHYEMARYGALIAWAKQAGNDDAAELLQQTLDEEKASDQRLNDLALRSTNPEAEAAGGEDEESAEEENQKAPAPRRRAAASRKPAGPEGAAEEQPAPPRRRAAASRKTESKPASTGGGGVKKPATRRGARK